MTMTKDDLIKAASGIREMSKICTEAAERIENLDPSDEMVESMVLAVIIQFQKKLEDVAKGM